MTSTYWQASKETAKKIQKCLDERRAMLDRAQEFAESVGADKFYTVCSFVGLRVAGVRFDDDLQVDRKKWIRLKGTADGWQPRARTEHARAKGGAT